MRLAKVTGRARTMLARSRRVLVVMLVSAVLGVSFPSAAYAHGAESPQSNMLVLQAISLIANDAGATAVGERINDALNAADKKDTDLAKVRQAQAIVAAIPAGTPGAADLARARTLLASAIAIRPATGYGAVPAPGQVGQDAPPSYASGADTGTITVLDEFKPALGVSNNGDAVLLALAVIAVIAGFYLARTWRPHDTITELRRRSAAVKES